jgi:hypothetical protein
VSASEVDQDDDDSVTPAGAFVTLIADSDVVIDDAWI